MKNGEINFTRYSIKITIPGEISLEDAISEISKKCRIVEVMVDNTIDTGEEEIIVHFSPNSRYLLYGEFDSLESALDLPDEIEIKGKSIVPPPSFVAFSSFFLREKKIYRTSFVAFSSANTFVAISSFFNFFLMSQILVFFKK
ncbi:unnamed protein product [Blepharisma stoltei]|uniref:Uncharacterized protein n=1 Tax=Blepharisma stoltei TaxID=1481888 RepID=A0AAU9JQB7_9CILI|nr:unnamed protein product [Blepharisma stoltei]